MKTYFNKASNVQQLINGHTSYDIANNSDNKTVHLLICKTMIEDLSNDYFSDDISDNCNNTSNYSDGTSYSYTCGIRVSNDNNDNTASELTKNDGFNNKTAFDAIQIKLKELSQQKRQQQGANLE